MDLPKLLLHSCCGPCSTAVIERLATRFDVSIFYYNPNITDPEEYAIRLANQKKFLDEYQLGQENSRTIDLMEGEYRPEDFFSAGMGMEDEEEGGSRCVACFRLRLEKTADLAKELGYPWFGTTLSVSPHKDYSTILQIGQELAKERGLQFLEEDFKKKAGYQRSIQMSKEFGLYRQTYCGCVFSKQD